jgi:hypothetical protein
MAPRNVSMKIWGPLSAIARISTRSFSDRLQNKGEEQAWMDFEAAEEEHHSGASQLVEQK